MLRGVSPLRTALIGFAILVVSMGIGRFAFTPILPLMRAEGLLSVSSGGALASVHFIGYAMGALMAGRLRTSPRATLFVSIIVIAGSTFAMGLTSSYSAWLVARWAAGVCSALVLVVVGTHFVRHLSDVGRADLQGVVFAGVGGGITLVGLAMIGLMATQSTSDLSWLAFGLATLFAAVLIHVLIGQQPFASANGSQPAESVRGARSWRIALPYGAMGAGYVIPATYLPVMAQESIALPLVFGWDWPVFGIAAVVSTLLVARLQDTLSNRRIWAACQLIMAAGLALPALWHDIVAVVLGGICVGGTFMVITMSGMKEAHDIAGSGCAQSLIAAMTASFAFGQIVGPILAGWAYEASGSFTYPLLIGSAALVLTLGPMLSPATHRPTCVA